MPAIDFSGDIPRDISGDIPRHILEVREIGLRISLGMSLLLSPVITPENAVNQCVHIIKSSFSGTGFVKKKGGCENNSGYR